MVDMLRSAKGPQPEDVGDGVAIMSVPFPTSRDSLVDSHLSSSAVLPTLLAVPNLKREVSFGLVIEFF
jgi:hypothetical protein